MATVAPGQLTFLVQSRLSLPKLEVILTMAAQSKLSLPQLLFVLNKSTKEGANKSAITIDSEWAKC